MSTGIRFLFGVDHMGTELVLEAEFFGWNAFIVPASQLGDETSEQQ
jgi:hypothetical protein